MTKTSSITEQFFKDVPLIEGNKNDDRLPFGFEDFVAISQETVYVLDFLTRGFRFVPNRNTFLCDHSVEEVLSLGYNFYISVIYCKDLPLMQDMHAAILRRLCNMNNLGDINYFSFVVRRKIGSQYFMTHHKLKPVFVDGKIRFGICLLTSSALKNPGHLHAHYANGIDFDEYSFDTKKWQKGTEQTLTVREKNILKLAMQGKTYNEIADLLHLSPHTIRNAKTFIYQKLKVQSMTQAVTYAINRRLIFGCNNEKKTVEQPKETRTRHLMTPDMILRIQAKLDIGQSVNSIAKQENIAESAIRYVINKGKLRRINTNINSLNPPKTQKRFAKK